MQRVRRLTTPTIAPLSFVQGGQGHSWDVLKLLVH